MGWMGIGWILGAALLAVLVWTLLKSARRRATGRGESPDDIVERRDANGEIEQETYQLDVDGSQRLRRTKAMTIANRKAI